MTTPVEDDAGPEPRPEHAHDPVRLLRRRWKPIKERLAQGGEHPSNVRFHRACSWLKRSLEAWHEFDDDVALVFGWTCLNALYGRWDPVAHQPENDRDGVRQCAQMLHHLSIAALDVYIDSGASTDWGKLCYPPTQ